MATPSEIRAAVDTKLASVWASVQTRQTSYAAANNGRFWQGIRSHAATPADGAESTPDIGTRTPSDQPGAPWPPAIRTASLPMSLTVDCYQAPSGPGYVATVEVTIVGRTWRRAAQTGPETWRAHPWVQAEATP